MMLPARKGPTRYSRLGPTLVLDNSRSRSRQVPAVLCKAFEVYVKLRAAQAAEVMERLGGAWLQWAPGTAE